MNPQTLDEALLIQNYKNGNSDAFGDLYDLYANKIYNFIYFKIHHKETAEDLMSQTFLKALEKLDQFNPQKGNFSSWLYRIARNNVIDHVRTNKNITELTETLELSKEEDFAGKIDTDENKKELRKVLKKLKPDQQELVILRVWHELSYKEIAEITGKKENNLKMKFSRTLNSLRKELPLTTFIWLLITNYYE